MPCRECVNRREFLAIAGGSAALAALGGCGDGITIPVPSRLAIVVGDFPGLANIGQLVKVGDAHAVKRTDTTTFQAFSMFCTHEGCLTGLSSGQFNCPCHGSQFNGDGTVKQGPASKSLQQLPTSYNPATDTLTIN